MRLLFSRCAGYTVDSVSIVADVSERPLKAWSVNGYRVRPPVDSVRLFDTPRGWREDERSLTALSEGVPYEARSMGTVDHRALNGQIRFTVGQVRELERDDVLVSDGGDKTKVMDRSDFLAAGSECGLG
ncbi:hypothetical protein [Streptomyces sp. NPDC090025]|uniref:hypothetical protein n=1 Tax=Streptomyces sp. NPDC090025 TaxID=3365922 RepID=UPI003837ED3C